MCDYSLMGSPNRLATEGEDLLVHRFASGSIGLTAAGSSQATSGGFWSLIRQLVEEAPQPVVAVCIPPGARLLVQDIPENLQCKYEIGRVEEVTFTQLSIAENTHRDAIRLNNGTEILLQRLRKGQRVRVLRLPLSDGGALNTVHVATLETRLAMLRYAAEVQGHRDR
jgi:hypothetical protein